MTENAILRCSRPERAAHGTFHMGHLLFNGQAVQALQLCAAPARCWSFLTVCARGRLPLQTLSLTAAAQRMTAGLALTLVVLSQKFAFI